jgi:hypothetical protein
MKTFCELTVDGLKIVDSMVKLACLVASAREENGPGVHGLGAVAGFTP